MSIIGECECRWNISTYPLNTNCLTICSSSIYHHPSIQQLSICLTIIHVLSQQSRYDLGQLGTSLWESLPWKWVKVAEVVKLTVFKKAKENLTCSSWYCWHPDPYCHRPLLLRRGIRHCSLCTIQRMNVAYGIVVGTLCKVQRINGAYGIVHFVRSRGWIPMSTRVVQIWYQANIFAKFV